MSKNAEVIVGLAKPRGRFPHYRRAGDFIFVSGTSSRRADDSFVGVSAGESGEKILDVAKQTRAVLENISKVLESAGSNLSQVVEISTFLVRMEDFPKYNEVYGQYFSESGPARTTVAVSELPHSDILIEIKAVAFAPVGASSPGVR